jgi:hypothetical protein
LAEEQNSAGKRQPTAIVSGRGELYRRWQSTHAYRLGIKLSIHLAGLGRSELSTLFRYSAGAYTYAAAIGEQEFVAEHLADILSAIERDEPTALAQYLGARSAASAA